MMRSFRFVRRLAVTRERYASVNIPRSVFGMWKKRGVTDVEIVFCPDEDILIVTPLDEEL